MVKLNDNYIGMYVLFTHDLSYRVSPFGLHRSSPEISGVDICPRRSLKQAADSQIVDRQGTQEHVDMASCFSRLQFHHLLMIHQYIKRRFLSHAARNLVISFDILALNFHLVLFYFPLFPFSFPNTSK